MLRTAGSSKETLNSLKEQLEDKVVVEEQEEGKEIVIEIQED